MVPDHARADSVANRNEPIPIIRVPSREDADFNTSVSDPETRAGKRPGNYTRKSGLRGEASKIKDKVGAYIEATPEVRQGIQERFFSTILSQIIPPDNGSLNKGVDAMGKAKVDRRSTKYVERPNFSVGMMSANFRRFNARIGIVFVLENRMIRLFSWQNKAATLSFLAVYSLICLNPHLLPVIPLAGLLFTIMIPSFLARHPISKNDPMLVPGIQGRAIAPATKVKPAPELSKDFFRNMRDLQNSMEDFSRLHDAANDYISPYTDFSDEALSSTLFHFLLVFVCVAFIGSHLIPWHAVALIAGWAATLMCHARVSEIVLSSQNLAQLQLHVKNGGIALRRWIEKDILFDDPPQQRQVEIFELQKFHAGSETWEPWLFCPSPWDPLSPSRISGSRPRGTQFFEDVEAPTGWEWKDKKWTLDLYSQEWVEQRMITGVEVETEGERWVFDLPDDTVRELATSPKKGGSKPREIPRSGWEEGTGHNERGEWRRRRWVRLVERKSVGSSDKNSG